MKKILFPILIAVVAVAGLGITRYQKEKQTAQESEANAPGSVPIQITPGVSQLAEEANISRATEITLTITSPADGAIVTSAFVTVKGKTAPRAEVFINDISMVADANGNFSANVTLDEGENPIVIFANDADGNVAEKELTVTYNSGQ